MKYFLLIITIVFFVVLTFILRSSKSSYITIKNFKIEIEIADTDIKREKGLSGRKILGENKGMLFVFPKSDYYYFWMKKMEIPLDFVWIEGEKVVDLTENVQAPKNNTDLKVFTSKNPANMVLEINAGSIQKNRFKIGDPVQILKI